jgi:hypothetical protein
MHECILKLLGYAEQRGEGGGRGGSGERKLVRVTKEWDEESLEALCKLLTTVGKQLDDVKTGGAGEKGGKGRPPPEHHERDLAFYYDRLRELSLDKKSGLAARARFMIKDVLELRENRWVPRRAEAKATKTEEFRREIEAAKPGGPPGGPAQGKGGGGGGGGGGGSRGGPGSPPLQRQGSGSSDKGRGGGDKRPAAAAAAGGGGGGGGGGAGVGGRSGPELRDRRGSIPPG